MRSLTVCFLQEFFALVHTWGPTSGLLSLPPPRWLIDTFGPDLVASGTGLLDVAGGMGELSFELVNINKLPSTVMDPRPLNLKGSLRKLRVGGWVCSWEAGP